MQRRSRRLRQLSAGLRCQDHGFFKRLLNLRASKLSQSVAKNVRHILLPLRSGVLSLFGAKERAKPCFQMDPGSPQAWATRARRRKGLRVLTMEF